MFLLYACSKLGRNRKFEFYIKIWDLIFLENVQQNIISSEYFIKFYFYIFWNSSFKVFDDIRIEDPRVTEFCNKTTEPTPHAILLTCLQRNYGLGEDVQINYDINRTHSKKNEFTMTVGKHTAKVLCKNKREGKQLASQAILQVSIYYHHFRLDAYI